MLYLGMNCPEWCINTYNKTKKTCNHHHHIYIYYLFFTWNPTVVQGNLSSWIHLSSKPAKTNSSSTPVAGKQNRERKKQDGLGANTQICVGVGGWAAPVQTYSNNPLGSQGNSKGNPASSPLCPTPWPFHKFGGGWCGLQREWERRLAHLVGFSALSSLPKKALSSTQVAGEQNKRKKKTK